jgi:4,5-DOPA dioxygenase extradiol
MNAIEDNEFTKALKLWGTRLQVNKPRAILAISAHWQTRGSAVTGDENPKMIFDFSGFPQELSQIKYPAKGSPWLVDLVTQLQPETNLDLKWGIDHGTWSVLVHLFPKADIPVVQLSLNRKFTIHEHLEFGAKLKALREEGVLILGSGNIVHSFSGFGGTEDAAPHPLALEFDTHIKDALINKDLSALTDYRKFGESARFAVPTSEHFLPLIYVVAVMEASDSITFPTLGIQFSSFSMRSVQIG